MIGAIKILSGIGFVAPIVGVVGGTYVATSKTTSSEQQTLSTESPSLGTEEFSSSSLEPTGGVRDTENSHWDTQESRDPIVTRPDSLGTSVNDSSLQASVTPFTAPEAPETLPTEPETRSELSDLPNTREEHLEETTQQVESGNCKVIDPLKHIFQSESQEETNYYSIFCEDIGQGEDLDIPNKFEGAFPKSIFKNRDWTKDKKIEMKVKLETDDIFTEADPEEDGDYLYGITFSSKQFTNESQLNGKLKYHDFDLGEDNTRSGAVVKLNHPEINQYIYLDWEAYR